MEDKPRNIFDAASQQSRKKIVEKKTASENEIKTPIPKSEPTKSPEINLSNKPLENLHKDPEINLMFNQMLQMQDEYQSKLTQIYDDNGFTTKSIRDYLENPNNFDPATWQKIKAQRDTLENQINTVLKKPKKTNVHISQEGKSLSKERKAKTLGARKNWIQM